MKRVWGISDTHNMHRQAIVPDNIDIMIFAGDCTNPYSLGPNEMEFRDFIDWFEGINIKYKILIAGNHDASLTKKYNKEIVEEAGIVYLEHEYANIEGISIFGSPYTPQFGNWYFMKDRGKLSRYWDLVEGKVDILVTHGPPKGILDLSESQNYHKPLEQCGDSALLKMVNRVRPKYHIFGHIHDNHDCKNFGQLTRDFGTIFMNVSSVEDGYFEQGLKHNGIVFEI